MSSKKMLIVSLGILVFFIAIIYIYNEMLTNVAKYYYSEVYVTEDGEINVKETIVIDFRQYMNYLYRDIVYEENPCVLSSDSCCVLWSDKICHECGNASSLKIWS